MCAKPSTLWSPIRLVTALDHALAFESEYSCSVLLTLLWLNQWSRKQRNKPKSWRVLRIMGYSQAQMWDTAVLLVSPDTAVVLVSPAGKNNNVLFLQTGAPSQLKQLKQTSACACACAHRHTHTHTHTHTQLEEVRFQRSFESCKCVRQSNFERDAVPDRWVMARWVNAWGVQNGTTVSVRGRCSSEFRATG